MKVLIIRTRLVKDTKEIETIKSLFDTTVIECEQYLDVIKAMINNKFDILHFPSHGDVNLLLLKNGLLSTAMFNSALKDPKLVFVNACSTVSMASVLNTENSISWRIEVDETTAVEFSNLFYSALYASNNIKQAFDAACEMIRVYDNKIELPIIFSRNPQEIKGDEISNFTFNISGDINTLIGQQK